MNRKRFFIPIVTMFIMTIIATSCTNCFTCIARDQDGVDRYVYPEQCGTDRQISEYTEECEAAYGSFDWTCDCSETQ